MGTILEDIYFKKGRTEREEKVLNAKKDIINYLFKEKLTISECGEIQYALKAYIESAREQALESTPIQHLLSKDS